ncbi:effector-associated constant component EACC1 [Micromonospora antibiotica]|uniref:Uncharacterized protein n=1 Tax=Micromonospora antibiotica TaxID=2807623 RepID=A0ABS3V886_9ACTN|nr:hypothetical protein [Micromonospora antibiotica]MBO4161830.1 hypothetical protein [Micromonospora antibiotica]
MGTNTSTSDIQETERGDSVHLRVSGRGADRELDALASWLRGNALLGGGWPVSRLRPDDDPDGTRMGVGDLDTLLVILQSTLGLAELIMAVRTWREARAIRGRPDLVVTIVHQGKTVVVSDDGDHVDASGPRPLPAAEPAPQPPTETDDDEC